MIKQRRFWFKYFIPNILKRTIYTLLGLIFYPFINRNNVRVKMNKGTNNWWTTQLFYMTNRDDVQENGIDWNTKMVEDKWGDHFIYKRIKGTKLGNLWASYWYNALRNPAYNYVLTHKPLPGVNNEVIVIDNLVNGEGIRVNPHILARWSWETKYGNISNRGQKIREDKSLIGEALFYWNPDGNNDITYGMYTHARKYNFLFWTVYESSQIGVFPGNNLKYDFKFKEQFVLKK